MTVFSCRKTPKFDESQHLLLYSADARKIDSWSNDSDIMAFNLSTKEEYKFYNSKFRDHDIYPNPNANNAILLSERADGSSRNTRPVDMFLVDYKSSKTTNLQYGLDRTYKKWMDQMSEDGYVVDYSTFQDEGATVQYAEWISTHELGLVLFAPVQRIDRHGLKSGILVSAPFIYNIENNYLEPMIDYSTFTSSSYFNVRWIGRDTLMIFREIRRLGAPTYKFTDEEYVSRITRDSSKYIFERLFRIPERDLPIGVIGSWKNSLSKYLVAQNEPDVDGAKIGIWDVETQEIDPLLTGHSVIMSADNETLYYGRNGYIYQYDLNSGIEIQLTLDDKYYRSKPVLVKP